MQTAIIDFGTRQAKVVFPSEGEGHRIPAILQYEERPTITIVGNTIFETPEYRRACFVLFVE